MKRSITHFWDVREEQLEKETAEYLDLKMATQKCRLTIASLEVQLNHFEAELVVLADCDDEYEAIKQQQIEFLISVGNTDSRYLARLQQKLATNKTAQGQLVDILDVGNEVIKIITGIEATSVNQAARLMPILQESLDHYQDKLKVISFQHSSPLQAKKTANRQSHSSMGTIGTALTIAGLVAIISLWEAPDFAFLSFSRPDLSNWLLHVKNLRSQIQKKTNILTDRLAWLNEEADKNQQKMENLIAAMWQPEAFAQSEV